MAAVPLVSADSFWLPVTDAELQMKAPVVDKNAGIEAIFTRVHVSDDYQSAFYRQSVHYVRMKVFTQEGKDKAAALEIPYDKDTTVTAITGRTVKPDGTILELGKDAIHDRVTVKVGGLKRMAKTLAMPGVEVGAIIEYRWHEVHEGADIKYMRLQFQDEFPIQHATLFVKPLDGRYVSGHMAIRPFNCQPSAVKVMGDGFSSVTLDNVAAFHEEPMMPGEPNVRPWILVYYDLGEKRKNPDKYWNDVAKEAYDAYKQAARASDQMKEAAAQAAAGARDDSQKMAQIIGWVRAHVRNVYSRQVSDEERAEAFKKMPKDRERTTAEILKSALATPDELNRLATAMASLAGLEARPVMIANRDDLAFDKRVVEELFLRHVDTAVSIGGAWKIFDASSAWLPARMLTWREEGVAALVVDGKKPEFTRSPISEPGDSQSTRVAKLKLGEDGALEGDVNETWTGHAAEDRREGLEGESADRQAENTKEEILKAYPQAEVSAVKLENAEDAEKPLALSYHIKIPGYASRTAKRILFQPVFFERSAAPLFSAAERKFDLVFRFPWQENDSVTIEFPNGFHLEKAENPGDMNFGDTGGYKLGMRANNRMLVCMRQLTFGNKGLISMGREDYASVKDVFDQIHNNDQVTLSLAQAAGSASE